MSCASSSGARSLAGAAPDARVTVESPYQDAAYFDTGSPEGVQIPMPAMVLVLTQGE